MDLMLQMHNTGGLQCCHAASAWLRSRKCHDLL